MSTQAFTRPVVFKLAPCSTMNRSLWPPALKQRSTTTKCWADALMRVTLVVYGSAAFSLLAIAQCPSCKVCKRGRLQKCHLPGNDCTNAWLKGGPLLLHIQWPQKGPVQHSATSGFKQERSPTGVPECTAVAPMALAPVPAPLEARCAGCPPTPGLSAIGAGWDDRLRRRHRLFRYCLALGRDGPGTGSECFACGFLLWERT